MRSPLPFICCFFLSSTVLPQAPAPLAGATGLLEIYKDLHAHPELSHHEERTSAVLAKALREAGYTVSEHIGRYPDGTQAFGVVAILKNGPGPTLLIRGDMDALPITEETALPYASKVTTTTKTGQATGVMHACGHDIHTTVLIGTARSLSASRTQWHGTLMLIGQPSEETIDGAKAMLADNLYTRFGTPDKIIGLHDINTIAADKIGFVDGPAMASSTSVDIVIHGIGGHGAYPHLGRDPIALAAEYITQIQTIVSREENPTDPAVVTVGTIHGGTKRNIISDEVKLELTTRAFSEHARQIILDGLKQMAAGVTLSAGLPPEKAITVKVLEDESTPPQVNDHALTLVARAACTKALGAENVVTAERVMGSEDVGVFGDPRFTGGKSIPVVYMRLGAMDPAKLAAAEAAGRTLPGMHTSRFEPLPEATIRTGVTTMSAVAISMLQ